MYDKYRESRKAYLIKKLKLEVCMRNSQRNEHTSFLYLSLKTKASNMVF